MTSQLGMVGLGRMGANMTERLRRAGIDVKTFDPKVESTADSLEELVSQLDAPRSVWLMVPAAIVDSLIEQVASADADTSWPSSRSSPGTRTARSGSPFPSRRSRSSSTRGAMGLRSRASRPITHSGAASLRAGLP